MRTSHLYEIAAAVLIVIVAIDGHSTMFAITTKSAPLSAKSSLSVISDGPTIGRLSIKNIEDELYVKQKK